MKAEKTRKRGLVAGIVVAAAALAAAVSISFAGAAARSDGSTATTGVTAGATMRVTTSLTAGVTTDADTAGLTLVASSDGAGTQGLAAKVLGTARKLMSDPAFREDLGELRDGFQADMKKWWDTYGDDPQSQAAQNARKKLREQHRGSIDKLLDKYGVDVSQARKAADEARAKIQKLMSDDGFRADLWQIRDAREAGMETWWDTYADDPTSAQARKALVKIHQKAREQLRDLLQDNGVDVPENVRGLLRGLGGALMSPGGSGGPGGGLFGPAAAVGDAASVVGGGASANALSL